jgi:hypothetical protein
MRKYRQRSGGVRLLVAILRVAAQRSWQAGRKESQKQQWKKCSCGQQSLNLADLSAQQL